MSALLAHKDFDWWLALCTGGVLVLMYSAPRFDAPSYDYKAGHYKRYAPRFTTYPHDYIVSRMMYLTIILGLYVIFSFALSETKSDVFQAMANPLAVALLIVSIDKLPQIKFAEENIRRAVHVYGLMPQAIRIIKEKLKGTDFNFNTAGCAELIKAVSPREGDACAYSVTDELIGEDAILYNWLKIGAMLSALSEENREKTGITNDFFEEFQGELRNIRAEHEFLTKRMRRRLFRRHGEAAPVRGGEEESGDGKLRTDIYDLGDRLYTFVACGARSSVATDIQCIAVLRALGFRGDLNFSCGVDIGKCVACLAAFGLLPVFFLVLSSSWVKSRIGPEVSRALGIPGAASQIVLWFLLSALVYWAAASTALSMRLSRINRRRWFDLENPAKCRPWPRYVAPVFWGCAAGSILLVLIAARGGPGFEPCDLGISDCLSRGFDNSVCWFSLPLIMAFAALWVSDSIDMNDKSSIPVREILVQALGFAAAMAAVALLIAIASPPPGIEKLEPANYAIAILFAPVQILVLAAVMLGALQAYAYVQDNSRRLVGKRLRVTPAKGDRFAIRLDPSGWAACFAGNERLFDRANARRHGSWVRFPEGVVLRWSPDSPGSADSDELGLIVWSGGVPIYQAFRERISQNPEYMAEIHETHRAPLASGGADALGH